MRATFTVMMLLTSALVGAGGPLPTSVGFHSASAAQIPLAQTSVSTHGMRISMLVPLLGSLPRVSLLQVRVRVTNQSGHVLTLPRLCDRSNPRVVVTNPRGVVVYTTVDTWPVPQRCSALSPLELAPGQSVERQNYVVLQGDSVQPVINLQVGTLTARITGKPYRLPVRSQYLTPYATAVFVDGSRRVIPGGRGGIPLYRSLRLRAIEVTARSPLIGPLVAVGSALCPGRSVLVSHWTVISRASPVASIPAPCARPRLWSIDYGWSGESMAEMLVGTGNLLPTAG
jgi:hypothetical protein